MFSGYRRAKTQESRVLHVIDSLRGLERDPDEGLYQYRNQEATGERFDGQEG